MENFWKIAFFTLYEYQNYFVSHFFPIRPIATKLWYKVQLGMVKKTRGERTFYLWQKKSYWVWKVNFDRFLAWKWVKIQISNSITFCVVKIKGSLTARFFAIPSCISCYILMKIGWVEKKCETKYFWYPWEVKKNSIFQKFSMVPCFTRQMAPSYQVFCVIGETSIFRPILTTPLV